MNLRDVTALVLVKNEEHFIGHVLTPLVKRLAEVIVFDTGSDDRTVAICHELGATVIEKGESNEQQIGAYRTEMCALAETNWTMIVDGDELYYEDMFDEIAKYVVPEGKLLGFTRMCSVDYVDGHYAQIDDLFNRVAFHPRGTIYTREYPFEGPTLFDHPETFFYIPTTHFALHLHRLIRSPRDGHVYLRKHKQFKYGLIDKVLPVVGPIDLPLNPNFPDPYAK